MQPVLLDTVTSRCHSRCPVCVPVLCSAAKGHGNRNTSDLLELKGLAELGGVTWRDLKHPRERVRVSAIGKL